MTNNVSQKALFDNGAHGVMPEQSHSSHQRLTRAADFCFQQRGGEREFLGFV
jgi:hypothetical protein